MLPALSSLITSMCRNAAYVLQLFEIYPGIMSMGPAEGMASLADGMFGVLECMTLGYC